MQAGDFNDPTQTRSEMSERSKLIITSITTLLVAIIGAAGVVYAGNLHISSDGSQDSQATITSLEGRVAELQDELSQERADGADVASSATTESSTGDPNTSTTAESPSSPVERDSRGQPVSLSLGYSFDVDSDAPDWDIAQGGTEFDDLWWGNYLKAENDAQMSVVDGVPAKEDCQASTGLVTQLPDDQTRAGTMLCLRTSDENFAYVVISSVERDGPIVFDVIRWG